MVQFDSLQLLEQNVRQPKIQLIIVSIYFSNFRNP